MLSILVLPTISTLHKKGSPKLGLPIQGILETSHDLPRRVQSSLGIPIKVYQIRHGKLINYKSSGPRIMIN